MSKFVEFSLRHSLKHQIYQIHQILISRYLSFRISINYLHNSSPSYLFPRRDYNQFPSLRRDNNYRSSDLPNKSSSTSSNRSPSYSREENNVQQHKYSREEIERIIRPREGEAERNYFSKTKLKSKEAIRSPIRKPFASDSYRQASFHDRDRGERFESRDNIDRMALREKYSNNMNSMMRSSKLIDRGYRDSRMNSSRFRTEYKRDDQYKSTINKCKTPDKIPKASPFPVDRIDRMNRIAQIFSGGDKKPKKQPIFVNPDYFNNNASIIVESDAPKLS
ncbi:4580_t:CDS:1, partial [Dentiscutata erythropus]